MANGCIGIEESFIIAMLESYINKTEISYLNIYATQMNWERLFRLLLEQKLFMCCYGIIKDIIPKQFHYKWMAKYYMIKHQIEKDIMMTLNVQNIIMKSGYFSATAKGFVYSQLIYDDYYIRQYNDVDIYVDINDIFEIGKTLIETGYTIKALSKEYISENIDLRRYFEERDECSFEDRLNPSRLIELKSVDVDAKLSNSMIRYAVKNGNMAIHNKTSIRTFDVDTAVYYLFMNAYKNHFMGFGKIHQRTLNDLFDVAMWMMRSTDFDYAKVRYMADKAQSVSSISAVITLAVNVFNIRSVPDNIKTYFEIGYSSGDREVVLCFDYMMARNEYYSEILNNTIFHNYSIKELNAMCFLPVKERMPMNCCKPNVYVSQKTLENIEIVVLVGDIHFPLYIDAFIWRRSNNMQINRDKISAKIDENQVYIESNEIIYMKCIRKNDGKIVFTLNKLDDMYACIDENGKKCVLIEMYIYLDKNLNMFDSWASIGWDFAPVVIDIIN